MNQVHQCLSDDVIRQLMACELDDEATRNVEEQLSQCDQCRCALESAMAEANWWRQARESLSEKAPSIAPGERDASEEDVLALLGPSDHPHMLGRIGTYEIAGVIGRGGMGIVFKALDPSLNRFVAIKMLAPQLAAWGAARKRFAREGQAAAAVVDDHVLPIYGVDEWQGMPYLVTQYSRGTTLQKRIQDHGPLETKEVLRIGMQAARGLAAAHAQGLVHRDVKPSNILLDGNVERAMLTDFGLARAVDDASITQTGVIAGTPQYMSPEQARGTNVDARSDLFGLGCVMYAMCTGRPPFRGENSFAIMKAITEKEPQPIREINPEIPAWLCQVIARLMAKSPDDRYAGADQVADLLGDCLAHQQQPTVKKLPPGLKAAMPGWRFSTMGKGLWLAVGLVLFGILGLALTQANPPDITGDWSDPEEWGEVHISKSNDSQWDGTFTSTTTGTPGKLTLTWSRISRRFNGKWSESEKGPFGELSIRVVDGEIRGAYSIDKQFVTDPKASTLADLAWIRASNSGPEVLQKIPHVGRLFDNYEAIRRLRNQKSGETERGPGTEAAPPDKSRWNTWPLEELKKREPASIADLRKRGHFIESADGKVYAYANSNHPHGPSEVLVVDSATGKLLATADISTVVGPLQFTTEGVASREADGKLELRVPLPHRDGKSNSPEPSKSGKLDSSSKAFDAQLRVGELAARGHFVASPDGKYYAYVETEDKAIRPGLAEIRVCDARTGKTKIAATIDQPVGNLKFLDHGVATVDADGTEKVRISHSDYPVEFWKTTPAVRLAPAPQEKKPDDRPPTPGNSAGLPAQICEKSPPTWAISSPEMSHWEKRELGPLFLDNERILWGSDIIHAERGELVGTFPFGEDSDAISAIRSTYNRKFFLVRGEPRLDRRTFASRTGWVQVWDVEKRTPFGVRISPDDVPANADIANDGRTVAIACRSGVTLWNAETGEKTKTLPVDLTDLPKGSNFFAPEFLRFSPDTKWLVTFSPNNGVYWQWQTDHKPQVIRLGRRLETFAFSPDSRFVAEGPGPRTNIQVRDLSSSDVLRTFFDEVDTTMITSGLTFTPDGKTLIASNSITLIESIKVPHRLHFWDVQKGTIKRQMATGKFLPRQLDISPNGKWLVVRLEGDKTTALAVWRVEE